MLNALVEEALKNNQDLAESLAKIDSAAAKLGVGTSQLAPSVSGAGAATSQSNSTKIANYNSIADRSYVNYQGQLSAAGNWTSGASTATTTPCCRTCC